MAKPSAAPQLLQNNTPAVSPDPLFDLVSYLRIGPALFAIKFVSQMRCASFGGCHPWPASPRRFVPHVLTVPTLQLRHPIAVFVLMESNNLSQRHLPQSEREQSGTCRYRDILLPVHRIRHWPRKHAR